MRSSAALKSAAAPKPISAPKPGPTRAPKSSTRQAPDFHHEASRSEIREVMDIRQASGYMGISPDTLYKYASEGFVPAFKLGNRWRFKKSRLDEWMDQQSDASMARPEVVPSPRQKKPVRAAR